MDVSSRDQSCDFIESLSQDQYSVTSVSSGCRSNKEGVPALTRCLILHAKGKSVGFHTESIVGTKRTVYSRVSVASLSIVVEIYGKQIICLGFLRKDITL